MEAFVRLENRDATKGHNKFYEMTLGPIVGHPTGHYNVWVRYGGIGKKPTQISLKGAMGSEWNAKEAFLKQLRAKFAKKEYNLVEHRCSDKAFQNDILKTQGRFEGETQLLERLAERDF